jgi:hypothetical protein
MKPILYLFDRENKLPDHKFTRESNPTRKARFVITAFGRTGSARQQHELKTTNGASNRNRTGTPLMQESGGF